MHSTGFRDYRLWHLPVTDGLTLGGHLAILGAGVNSIMTGPCVLAPQQKG